MNNLTIIDNLADEFILAMESDLFKALFDPVRIQILILLMKKSPMNVAQIAENFEQDRSVISRHLRQMHQAGILILNKVSRDTFYQINGVEFPDQTRALMQKIISLMDVCCPPAWRPPS